jgi:hypothetical protein
VAAAFLISEQPSWLRLSDRVNTWFLRLLADVRTPWLTDVANAAKVAGTGWGATVGHVGADRWYKLWRSILYGSLEDESPYHSVRRLVTYEDYALRLLEDIGVRTPVPHGVVESPPSVSTCWSPSSCRAPSR